MTHLPTADKTEAGNPKIKPFGQQDQGKETLEIPALIKHQHLYWRRYLNIF